MTSAINPNDINGSYPVAGQDNNSQGFRDNFTNTKTNFQYAADEITEIQNKGIFKSAIAGTSLNNNMNYANISNVVLVGQTTALVSGSTLANPIAVNQGGYQVIGSVTGNVSLNIGSWPTTGYATVRAQLNLTGNANITMAPSIGRNDAAASFAYIQGKSGNVVALPLPTGNSAPSSWSVVFEFSSPDQGNTVFIQDLTRGANATPKWN